MKKMFHNLEHAQRIAHSLQAGPAADEIGRMMFEASERGDNACFLHQSAIYWKRDCICQACKPGAANGLFAGSVLL